MLYGIYAQANSLEPGTKPRSEPKLEPNPSPNILTTQKKKPMTKTQDQN